MSKNTKLSTKQQRFVDCYTGNATEAALKAGYSKRSAKTIGHENMTKPYIKKAIEEREQKLRGTLIADRNDRLKFWTDLMFDRVTEKVLVEVKEDGTHVYREIPIKMKDRLKASEYLGRTEADFIDRHVLEDPGGVTVIIREFKEEKE